MIFFHETFMCLIFLLINIFSLFVTAGWLLLSVQYLICCLVLISQLFGEEDADQEVSPDTADPEAACE